MKLEKILDPDHVYFDATPSIEALTEAISNLSKTATKQLDINDRLIMMINNLCLRVSQLEDKKRVITMPLNS